MDLHSLKNVPGARKKRKRVGRGPGSRTGKTSGRGHKGQMARKGATHKPGFEGGQMRLVRRIPKRGFKNPARKILLPVNVSELERFDDGANITYADLKKAGLAKGPADGVKILGRGDISKKLNIQAQSFSSSAQSKIEAAGGVCEVVPSV